LEQLFNLVLQSRKLVSTPLVLVTNWIADLKK
jgi:hypothetical protein